MESKNLNPDLNLVWVETAAYGDAYSGYDKDNLNSADSVKEILRIKWIGNQQFKIEHWRRGLDSLFSESYENILLARIKLKESLNILKKKKKK